MKAEGEDYKARPPEQSGGQQGAAELVSEFALQVLPIGTLRPDQLFTFRAPPGFTAEPRAILPVEIIVPASVADFTGKSLRMSAAAVVWHRLVRAT